MYVQASLAGVAASLGIIHNCRRLHGVGGVARNLRSRGSPMPRRGYHNGRGDPEPRPAQPPPTRDARRETIVLSAPETLIKPYVYTNSIGCGDPLALASSAPASQLPCHGWPAGCHAMVMVMGGEGGPERHGQKAMVGGLVGFPM